MFKKMQLKLTAYYSIIMIAAIFGMSALLYFFVYEFSSQNLLSDFKSDLDAISEVDWIKESALEDEADRETDEEHSSEDDEEHQIIKAYIPAKIEKIPSLLNHFSNYTVVDAAGGVLFEYYQTEHSKEDFSLLMNKVILNEEPGFLTVPDQKNSVYIGYSKTIIIEGEIKGRYMILHDVALSFKTLSELLNILLIFGIAGSILAIGLGYIIAGRVIKPVSNAYHQKQIFLENVSHEMRTPLSAIMLNAELLELGENEMTPQKQESYDAIRKEVTDLREQIGALLNKERKPIVSKHYSQNEINLSQVLATEVNRLRIIANENRVTLNAYIQPDLYLNAHQRDVVNVFRILIDNAIKYSFENGIVEIALTQRNRLDNEITFQLIDHGCGIDPIELPNIFKRDYRASSRQNQSKEGYGLGLSIVEEILNKLNAKIEVASILGEGTTFIVTFFKSE